MGKVNKQTILQDQRSRFGSPRQQTNRCAACNRCLLPTDWILHSRPPVAFHQSCFACALCRRLLQPGDNYLLDRNDQPLCLCHGAETVPLANHSASTTPRMASDLAESINTHPTASSPPSTLLRNRLTTPGLQLPVHQTNLAESHWQPFNNQSPPSSDFEPITFDPLLSPPTQYMPLSTNQISGSSLPTNSTVDPLEGTGFCSTHSPVVDRSSLDFCCQDNSNLIRDQGPIETDTLQQLQYHKRSRKRRTGIHATFENMCLTNPPAYCLAMSTRQKRMRTSFKHHQLRAMKAYFNLNHNPDVKDLKVLTEKTGLSKRVLQVWFQNARAKYRRGLLRQDDPHLPTPNRPAPPSSTISDHESVVTMATTPNTVSNPGTRSNPTPKSSPYDVDVEDRFPLLDTPGHDQVNLVMTTMSHQSSRLTASGTVNDTHPSAYASPSPSPGANTDTHFHINSTSSPELYRFFQLDRTGYHGDRSENVLSSSTSSNSFDYLSLNGIQS